MAHQFTNARRVFAIWGAPAFFTSAIAIVLAWTWGYKIVVGKPYFSPHMFWESWGITVVLYVILAIFWALLTCAMLTVTRNDRSGWTRIAVAKSAIGGWLLATICTAIFLEFGNSYSKSGHLTNVLSHTKFLAPYALLPVLVATLFCAWRMDRTRGKNQHMEH